MPEAKPADWTFPPLRDRLPMVVFGSMLVAAGVAGFAFTYSRLVRIDLDVLFLAFPAAVAIGAVYVVWYAVVYQIQIDHERVRIVYPFHCDVVRFSEVAYWKCEMELGYVSGKTASRSYRIEMFDKSGNVLAKFPISRGVRNEIAILLAERSGIPEWP